MLSYYIINAIDNFFVGVIMLFSGDFKQLPVVVPYGSFQDVFLHCVKNSNCWPKVKNLFLKVNVRASVSQEFTHWLEIIGNGSDSEMAILPHDFVSDVDMVILSQNHA